AKEDERGDAANAEPRRGLRARVAVDLGEDRLALQLPSRPLDMRRHRPARAAPGGPEVDDDRQLVASDEALEVRIVDRDRLSVEQGGGGTAAHRLSARAPTRAP